MQSMVHAGTSRALLAFVVLCTSTALGGEPEWVRKRPIIPHFYVGIGTTLKNRPVAEYTEGARSIALNDIASQITVSISSDVLRTVLEKNERLEEEFQSRIRASASADLEGVELVDTYENDGEYWVYLRLSRADYEARRAEKINAAAAQSLDLFSGGVKSEREGKVGQALGLYARAFEPIEKYLAEPLVVQSGGGPVYLVNDIYDALRTLLNRIEVRTAAAEIDAKIGRPLRNPLEWKAVLRGTVASPVPDLPFSVAFTRGSGDCVDRVRTDGQGVARCAVQKITADDRIQVIEAGLDLPGLAGGEQMSPVVRTLLGSFTLPGARFVLNVSGLEVYLRADESMFGQPLQPKRIEPAVKSELGAKGFSFVDDRTKASIVINVLADARRGTESSGLAFAFASGTVSVVDAETGKEVFTGSVRDVKEGSNTFEKAAYRGFETLARRIVREVLPQLIQTVQK